VSEHLLLYNDEIASVFDLEACMAALERAYQTASDGRAVERACSQRRGPGHRRDQCQ
jgi:hypothetical protein